MVRGEPPSFTSPPVVVWAQRSGWCPCWRPWSRACSNSWRNLQTGRPSSNNTAERLQLIPNSRSSHSFIYSKFQEKKRKYKKVSDTHLETVCQKYTISSIGVKKTLRPQIQSLKRRQSLVKFFFHCFFFFLFWIISFPNQVMNTEILWKYYNKIIAVDQAPPQKA